MVLLEQAQQLVKLELRPLLELALLDFKQVAEELAELPGAGMS